MNSATKYALLWLLAVLVKPAGSIATAEGSAECIVSYQIIVVNLCTVYTGIDSATLQALLTYFC